MARGLLLTAYMSDDAVRELRALERRFPAEFSRALSGVGFFMRRKIQQAIRSGGPKGHKWQRLSRAQQSQRIEMAMGRRGTRLFDIRRKRAAKMAEGSSPLDMLGARFRKTGSRTDYPMNRMVGGIRYKKVQGGKGVIIGGVTPSMEKYLIAVQDGAVTDRGSGAGGQAVTRKMQRLFFAAGIPLTARRTRRPKRPLMEPIMEQYGDAMMAFMRERVRVLLVGPNESRDETAKRVGMWGY